MDFKPRMVFVAIGRHQLTTMQDLHNLQTAQLVDLLVEQTTLLTSMFAEKKFGNEYERQKLRLKAIQSEIDFRRNTADVVSTNITTPPDFS